MQETWVRSLGREDPLEKEMVTHSSVLAWRSLVGYSPRGHREPDTTERLHLHLHLPQVLFTLLMLCNHDVDLVALILRT